MGKRLWLAIGGIAGLIVSAFIYVVAQMYPQEIISHTSYWLIHVWHVNPPKCLDPSNADLIMRRASIGFGIFCLLWILGAAFIDPVAKYFQRKSQSKFRTDNAEKAKQIRQFVKTCNDFFDSSNGLADIPATLPQPSLEEYEQFGDYSSEGLLKLVSEASALAPYIVEAGEDSKPLHLFCKYLVSIYYEPEARRRWIELEGQLLHCADVLDRKSA